MFYIKHLIKCKCVLPQYKYSNPQIQHSFIVFSVLNQNGDVEPSFSQCNNCGIIHKVIEIGNSVILKKEDMPSLITIDEIKKSLPESLNNLLQSYELPISTWQEIQFILENELWGKHFVILSKEEIEGTINGKYLLILGKELYKIHTFTREEYVNG